MTLNSLKIRNAIATVAFTLNQEYELYMYCLTQEEKAQQLNDVEEARNFLVENGIAYDAAFKHAERVQNTDPCPVRFIDRRLKPVEIDELPF